MLSAATTLRPRLRGPLAVFVIMVAALAVSAAIRLSGRFVDDYPRVHRFYSAFAMLHRATCEQSADYQKFLPNALQHDAYGNPYLFICNGDHFTVVSAGPDGIYETADDVRSDR